MLPANQSAEVRHQYLCHHYRHVSKKSPVSPNRERGTSGEHDLQIQRPGSIRLHAFVVMPEHLHVMLTPGEGQTVERSVQCIKGGFSFAVRKQFTGEVWQAGFHEHRIRDTEDFRSQIEYVAANPGRRRLIDYPFVHTNYAGLLDTISDATADVGAGLK